jgi:putative MATE family efflux protein
MKKSVNKLSNSKLLKNLLTLAIPIIFANMLQTAYNLTDIFWVGRLGAEAVAAVTMSFPAILVSLFLIGGFSIAGTILVSQYKGKKNQRKINHVATQTISVGTVLAIITGIMGYFIAPSLIQAMGTEAIVEQGAISYLQISFIGMVFVFGFMIFESLMRGIGKPKIPMLIVLGTVLLNLLLDPLFIFGYGIIPGFGVGGAAIATTFTQGIAFLVGLYFIFKGRGGIKLNFKKFKFDFPLIKKMFKLGIPTSIEQSSRSFSMLLLIFIVTQFSTGVIAAYGIGIRIMTFIMIPSFGISIATSTLVGMAMGAKQIEKADRISRISMWTAFFGIGFLSLILFLFSSDVAAFLLPGDPIVIETASLFVKLTSLAFGFIGIQLALIGTLRGAGDTKSAMMLALVTIWGIRLPLAYLLPIYTDLSYLGVWLAFPIEGVIGAFIVMLIFFKGDWKKKKIV